MSVIIIPLSFLLAGLLAGFVAGTVHATNTTRVRVAQVVQSATRRQCEYSVWDTFDTGVPTVYRRST